MLEYRAEGLCRNANHLSREELSRCMASGEVLQSTALAFDTNRRLRFTTQGTACGLSWAGCAASCRLRTVWTPLPARPSRTLPC